MTVESIQAGMRRWTISLAGPGWFGSSFQGTVSVLVAIKSLKMSSGPADMPHDWASH